MPAVTHGRNALIIAPVLLPLRSRDPTRERTASQRRNAVRTLKGSTECSTYTLRYATFNRDGVAGAQLSFRKVNRIVVLSLPARIMPPVNLKGM